MNKIIKQLETQLTPIKQQIEDIETLIRNLEGDLKPLRKEKDRLCSLIEDEQFKDVVKATSYQGGLLTIGSATYVIKPNRVECLTVKKYYGSYIVILEYKPLESVRKEVIEFKNLTEEQAKLLYDRINVLLFKKGIQDDKIN